MTRSLTMLRPQYTSVMQGHAWQEPECKKLSTVIHSIASRRLKPVVPALQEFLVICSWQPRTYGLPKSTSSHFSVNYDGYDYNPGDICLPTEIWREIASWLTTRADLRNLFSVRHSLGRIASELLSQDVSLHSISR